MHVLSFDKFAKGSFKIAFLGDMMGQNELLMTITNDDPFKYIKNWLYTTNYVVGGLETTFSGLTHDYENPNTPPQFSTNDIYADQLASFVNLAFTANNHSYDYQEKGVKRTIEVLNDFGIEYIGTNDLPKIKRVFDVDINGHKLSFLNYTQFLNETKTDPVYRGVNSAQAPPNLINFFDEAKVKETINLAKERSELVIIGIHQSYRDSNARENDQRSTRRQREFLKSVIDMGADVVLGSHPHLFQGATVFDGGKIAVNSLGNFYSAMKKPNLGCIMLMNCDSYTNISYSFLPIATVVNEKSGHQYVIPMAPLEGGNYDWVTEEQRINLLGELGNIRKTLRTFSLIEEEIPVHFL